MNGLVHYTVSASYIELMNSFFNREPILRFNIHRGSVIIDSSLSHLSAGDILLFEVYKLCDPDQWRHVWNDRWLRDYTSALIKKQWGQNMLKYEGVQLPSGISLNGRAIYTDALTELTLLEQELEDQAFPVDFLMG